MARKRKSFRKKQAQAVQAEALTAREGTVVRFQAISEDEVHANEYIREDLSSQDIWYSGAEVKVFRERFGRSKGQVRKSSSHAVSSVLAHQASWRKNEKDFLQTNQDTATEEYASLSQELSQQDCRKAFSAARSLAREVLKDADSDSVVPRSEPITPSGLWLGMYNDYVAPILSTPLSIISDLSLMCGYDP